MSQMVNQLELEVKVIASLFDYLPELKTIFTLKKKQLSTLCYTHTLQFYVAVSQAPNTVPGALNKYLLSELMNSGGAKQVSQKKRLISILFEGLRL